MHRQLANKPMIRLMVSMIATVVALSACTTAEVDRVGGTAPPEEVHLLRMASPNQGPPPVQVSLWVDEVEQRSGGTIQIEVVEAWRLGEPDYEQGTVADVIDEEIDMAAVGVRAMDQLGDHAFQGLLAPLLVDSHALQAEVFAAGIPDHMMARLDVEGITGLAVLPGPMRKLLGLEKPYLIPGDFTGEVIGIQASDVAEETFTALGATPKLLPTSASLDEVDGYEQQLGSILGNRYYEVASHVTSNVNLWPRPTVIVISSEVFSSLSGQQQEVLRAAGAEVLDEAMSAAIEEDETPVHALCQEGMLLEAVSQSDLDQIDAALASVYEELTEDAAVAADIEATTQIKASLNAPADTAACDTEGPIEALIPNGTYEMTLTGEEAACVPVVADQDQTLFVMTLDDGFLDQQVEYGGRGGPEDAGWNGTYEVFADRIELTDSFGTLSARWEFDGNQLILSEMDGGGCDDVTVWTTKPWTLTQQATGFPLGMFVSTITADDYTSAGMPVGDTGEFTLALSIDEWKVLEPETGEVGFQGTYSVFGDQVEVTDGTDTFTARWRVEEGSLILSDLVVAGIPGPNPFAVVTTSYPWVRVDG